MWITAAAGLATSLLLSSCGCTARGCLSGVDFKLLPVALDDAARLHGATIEICHNDVCGREVLPPPPELSHTGASVSVDDPIHTFVEATVWRFDSELDEFEVGYTVAVRISARHAVLIDGDIYTATVTAADDSIVASAAFRASSHREFYPNGEHCDEQKCRVAVLEPL
jgi:hypothetical protein